MRKAPASSATTPIDSISLAALPAVLQPDLARIIAAWPKLSKPIRNAILALNG
jgi:hypothetical protein